MLRITHKNRPSMELAVTGIEQRVERFMRQDYDLERYFIVTYNANDVTVEVYYENADLELVSLQTERFNAMSRLAALIAIPVTTATSSATTDVIETLTLETDQTPIAQHSIVFRIETGQQIYVDWGDGNTSIVTGIGAADVTATSTYTAVGTYDIAIVGVLKYITSLEIDSQDNLSGTLEVSKLTGLTQLILGDLANLVVDSGEIGTLTPLEYLQLDNCPNVTVGTGEIGSLTSLIVLLLTDMATITVGAGEVGRLTALYFLGISTVPNVTISAGEVDNLTSLYFLFLDDLANVTIGAGEVGTLTTLGYLALNDLPNVTIGAGEIGSLTSLLYLGLSDLLSLTINAGEIGGLILLEAIGIDDCATVTVAAGEIGGLTTLVDIYFENLPNVTIGAGEIGLLISLTDLDLVNMTGITIGAGEIGALTLLEDLYLDTLPLVTIGAGEFKSTYTELVIDDILLCAIDAAEDLPDINIYINDCNMSIASVDNLLIRLDALGYVNHTLTAAGSNGAHTNPGAAENARLALVANGWTVTVN